MDDDARDGEGGLSFVYFIFGLAVLGGAFVS
jgi:hypothetical protein